MFGLSNSIRVFLAVEPVDLRKSFNGLHGVVLDRLKEDPCSGAFRGIHCGPSSLRALEIIPQ